MEYLTATDLKDRGWTKRETVARLGKPDGMRPDPTFPNAPMTPLYLVGRVVEAEGSRSVDVVVDVPRFGREELIRLAVDRFPNTPTYRAVPGVRAVDPLTNPGLLAFACVDYLRFEVVSRLAARCGVWVGTESFGRLEVGGMTRFRQAADMAALNTRVYGELAEAYPWLAAECRRRSLGAS